MIHESRPITCRLITSRQRHYRRVSSANVYGYPINSYSVHHATNIS